MAPGGVAETGCELSGGGVEMSGTAGCALMRQRAGDERHRLLRLSGCGVETSGTAGVCTCEGLGVLTTPAVTRVPRKRAPARALPGTPGTSGTTENEPLVDRKVDCGADVSDTKPPTVVVGSSLAIVTRAGFSKASGTKGVVGGEGSCASG